MIRAILMLIVACYAISAVTAKPSPFLQGVKTLLKRLVEKSHGSAYDDEMSKHYDVYMDCQKMYCTKIDWKEGDNAHNAKEALKSVKVLIEQASNIFQRSITGMNKSSNGTAYIHAIEKFMQDLLEMAYEAKCADRMLEKATGNKDPQGDQKCKEMFTEWINYESKKENICNLPKEMRGQFNASFHKDLNCLAKELEDLKKRTDSAEKSTQQDALEILNAAWITSHDIHAMFQTMMSLHLKFDQYMNKCQKQNEQADQSGQNGQGGQSGQNGHTRRAGLSRRGGESGQTGKNSGQENEQSGQQYGQQTGQSDQQNGQYGQQTGKSGQANEQYGQQTGQSGQANGKSGEQSRHPARQSEQGGQSGQHTPGQSGEQDEHQSGQQDGHPSGQPGNTAGQTKENGFVRSAKRAFDVQLFARLQKLFSELNKSK